MTYFEDYSKARVFLIVGFIGGAVACMLNCPEEFLWVLPNYTTACVLLSRLPQIYTNFRNKHTGVLSAITCFLQTAGSGARLLTVLAQVDDVLVRRTQITGFLLNVVILAQVLVFWSRTRQVMKEKVE